MLWALLAVSIFDPVPAFARKRTPRKATVPNDASALDAYLVDKLSVEPAHLAKYNLTLRLRKKAERGLGLAATEVQNFDAMRPLDEAAGELLYKRISKDSFPAIKGFTQALGQKAYNNVALLGAPGVGKTFSVEQLVAIYSYGMIPPELASILGFDSRSKFKAQFRDSYVGKTRFVAITSQLLSLDNSGDKAMAKAEVRMKSIVHDLFEVAKADFQGDKKIRTVFVLEEAAQLSPEVYEVFKTMADEAGFKNPANLLEAGAETGVSFLALTTPDEYRQMINGDGATERRFNPVFVLEPTEQRALEILRNEAHEMEDRFGLRIDDDVLQYIIGMRRFFDHPPQAMPGGVIKAMDGLFNWAAIPSQRPNPDAEEITLEDAYHYLVEKNKLPKDLWIPKTPGVAPLQDLENRVKNYLVGEAMVGDGHIVDTVVGGLKHGRLDGFQEMPFYIIMGPSGSGKDSLARAINLEMFGHDGENINFGVGVSSEQAFLNLVEGTPGSTEPPEIIKRLDSGASPNGVIVLNEGKDLPSHLFDKLKTIVERGAISPVGRDSRVRPLGFNAMFLMGQWGEELFEGLSDEAAMDKWRELVSDKNKLMQILMDGKNNKREGSVPFALIARALKTGGLVLLPPVMKKDYIEIVRRHVRTLQQRMESASRLKITIDESVEKAILQVSKDQNTDVRGLQAIVKELMKLPASMAVDHGFPAKRAEYALTFDGKSIVVKLVSSVDGVQATEFKVPLERLTVKGCEATLKKAVAKGAA